MAKETLSIECLQTRENFFRGKYCGLCRSDDMLELDSVDPFRYPPTEIWGWDSVRREIYFKDNLQILCHECYMRKKNLWKQYAREGGFWYDEFKRNN